MAATIQIMIDNLVFAPTEVSAKVGDTIEWINKDMLAHTATARNGDFDVTMPPKKTVTSVLKKAGTVRILLPVPSEYESRAQDRTVAQQARRYRYFAQFDAKSALLERLHPAQDHRQPHRDAACHTG